MAPLHNSESQSPKRRRDPRDDQPRRHDDVPAREASERSHTGPRRRSRERDRSRQRRRSLTPESASRRPHGRDRDRRRSRERDRDGDQSRRHGRGEDRRRRGSREGGDRDRDRDGLSHRRRRDADEDKSRRGRLLEAPKSPIKRGGPLPSQEASFAVTTGEEPEIPKERPNLSTTGLLAAASNSVTQADGSTVTLKYHEPAEARKPSPRDQWKLFVFKGADVVDTIDLSARSCWLVGRDQAVVDLPAEHPSISKQHAVIQFRYTEKRNEFGDKLGKVKPYLIDLESANGTILNDSKVPESRYLELRDKDMVQFGHSTREYVVMLAPRE